MDQQKQSPPRSWFTPGVAGIGLASFFSDVGHEVPTALLPSLLSSLGAPAAVLGLIEGLANGASGLARLAGGPIADDPGQRKQVAIGGYASTALLSSLIGIAAASWQVGAFRVAAWTARGLRVPARNALLADIAPADGYGRAYGFERAMDNLGAIVGPALALVLVSLIGVRSAILVSIVPGLFAAAAIFFAVARAPRLTRRTSAPLRIKLAALVRGPLGRLLLAMTVLELGGAAATLLILRATQALTPHLGLQGATQTALGLYIAYNVAATLISFPAGYVSDHRGPVWVVATGALMFAGGYLAFTSGSIAWLAIGFVLAGLAAGALETGQHAAVAAIAPADLRGSAFGLLAAMQSFGGFAASAVAGLLWTIISPAAAFFYLAVCMGLGGLATLVTAALGGRTPEA
ncbi:MFS transporter [Phenylobacterium montanum]|nr:MFS transporter [Caulobacter sp. S6]